MLPFRIITVAVIKFSNKERVIVIKTIKFSFSFIHLLLMGSDRSVSLYTVVVIQSANLFQNTHNRRSKIRLFGRNIGASFVSSISGLFSTLVPTVPYENSLGVDRAILRHYWDILHCDIWMCSVCAGSYGNVYIAEPLNVLNCAQPCYGQICFHNQHNCWQSIH